MKNLSLFLLLGSFFVGNLVSAQSAETTTKKVERTYAKKPASAEKAVSETAKPARTYARKTSEAERVNPALTEENSVKEKKTVTKAEKKARKTAAKYQKKYRPANGGYQNGHNIKVGPRGGRYYINKNGNKTYVK